MANILYIGFDNYSQRYCYKIKFSNDIDRVKFEINFNMNFKTNEIQAEIDKFEAHTEKVVFTEEMYKHKISIIIEGILGEKVCST